MISKKWLKLIHSLQVKKYRKLHQAFLVEGAKSVQELLSSDYQITILFATQEFYNENIRQLSSQSCEWQIVTKEELEQTGVFQSNNACLAIVQTKPNQPLYIKPDEYALVLDGIKDPGNLGTIIRIADWYGIYKIICSETTTEIESLQQEVRNLKSMMMARIMIQNTPLGSAASRLPWTHRHRDTRATS